MHWHHMCDRLWRQAVALSAGKLGIAFPQPVRAATTGASQIAAPAVLAEEWDRVRVALLRRAGRLCIGMHTLAEACSPQPGSDTGLGLQPCLAEVYAGLEAIEAACGMETTDRAGEAAGNGGSADIAKVALHRLRRLPGGALLPSAIDQAAPEQALTAAPSLLVRNLLPIAAGALLLGATAQLWSGLELTALIADTWRSATTFATNFTREQLVVVSRMRPYLHATAAAAGTRSCPVPSSGPPLPLTSNRLC